MAGLSDAVELKVLEHIVGKTAYTMPTTYLALSTATVTDTTTLATLAEPAYTGYARVATSGKWASAASGAISNNAAITFADCTSGSATVTDFAIVSTASGTTGDIIAYGALTAPVDVSTTQTPINFASGAVTVTAN